MRTTIAFAISGRGRLRVFTTQEPPQLIVEGADLGFASDLAQLTPAGPHLVADYRFGLADPTTGRIVLDLQRSAKIASADRLPAGLTVELHASDAAAPGEPIVVDLTDSGVVATSMPARPQHRRPVVVIDPGHGGRDPGAVADGNILEKDVVLAVAKRLVGSLSALQRFDVRMTRDADTSVSLDQRLAFSRLAQADLFLSLHADTFAGQPQAAVVRGGSVYVLADRASNRSAAALAEKENAADLRLGADFGLSSGNAAIDGILSDLTSRETQAFASDAQAGLVRSLKGVIQLARDPSRGAAFKVLKQAETPAVLIELGYLSHAQDIALLQSADWQSRVATAITRAIEGYFSDKRSVLSTK